MRGLHHGEACFVTDQQVIHAIITIYEIRPFWSWREMGRETDANGLYRAIGWEDADLAELTKEIRSLISDYKSRSETAPRLGSVSFLHICAEVVYKVGWAMMENPKFHSILQELWFKCDDFTTRPDAATNQGTVGFMAIHCGSFDS